MALAMARRKIPRLFFRLPAKMGRRSGAKRPRCDPGTTRFVSLAFVSRVAKLEIRVSSQMLKQLTSDHRKSLPHSPPLACEWPRWPKDFDPTCDEWWKWVGNPWHGNPWSDDPGEPPSDLEELESDEVMEVEGWEMIREEDEVEEEELEIDPDGPPYLPEGNGLDEDYISDSEGAMADCEDNIGFDEAYVSDSDRAMADSICEDENLERGIISTTMDEKVATHEWYRSILT